MKTLLALLLITQLAYADTLRIKRTDTDYVFSYVENGVHYCWIMHEWVDLNYFDYTWRTVPDTARTYNWPTPTLEQIALCDARIPRTVSTSAFTFNGSGALQRADDVPIGLPCGDKISTHQLYHAIHYAGRDMVGVCW
jgi:hypothetical protein